MIEWKNIIVGFLTLLIATSVVYITLNNNLRIRVDGDKSTFYVKDGNRWIVSGREYNYLYDGTTKLNRQLSATYINTTINETEETVTITRYTKYIKGPVIIDTYFFDGNLDDVELFPISHKIEIFNGTGFYYRYDVKELTYDGDTFKLDGNQISMNFGKNMKVTWWEGYRIGWIYKAGSMYVKSEKLQSDYETFDVRLFDPFEVGINYGLVTTTPVGDPGGNYDTITDAYSRAQRITTTAPITITEIGWYTTLDTEEANFEVGIYSHDSGINQPANLLYSDVTNAKGTLAGWKKKDGLDWDLNASTIYWLAIQLDNTATSSKIPSQSGETGEYTVYHQPDTTLPSSWSGNLLSNYAMSIYAIGAYTFGGSVKDALGVAIYNATILIINQSDNKVVSTQYSASDGTWDDATIVCGNFSVYAYMENETHTDGDNKPHINISKGC